MGKHKQIWTAIDHLRGRGAMRQRGIEDLTARVEKLAGRLDAQEGIHWDKIKELEGLIKRLEDGPTRNQMYTLSEAEIWGAMAEIRQKSESIDAQVDEMWNTLMPPGDRPNVSDIATAQAAHDKQELGRLVDYIRSELPDGTAGMGETVTDIAIRRLKTYRAALQNIMETKFVDGLMHAPSVTVYWTARNALEGRDALDTNSKQGDDVKGNHR